MLSPLSLASLWYRVQPQSAMRWELEAGVRGKRASRVLLERHCTEVPPAGEWLNVERPAATRSLLPPTAAAGAAWCVLPPHPSHLMSARCGRRWRGVCLVWRRETPTETGGY